jgi:spore coat polysaccharide biosynthesis predicted glycosyltransferase SpsG
MAEIIGKKNKNVLIRADGSKEIGMGHLRRACLLARMFMEKFGFKTKLVMKENEWARKFLSNRRIEVIALPEAIEVDEESELLWQISKEECPVLFVVDVLEQDINAVYMNELRKIGCLIIAITDDSYKRIINADLILNGNPNQVNLDYSQAPGRYLLGPKYFLMDYEYISTEVEEPKENIRKILLTLGGGDQNNLLFMILDMLVKIRQDLLVMIVTSKASGYLDRLRDYLKQISLTYELLTDVETLAGLWSKCDIAITAGGNTLFERIASRLPGATICQLKRQVEIAEKFESFGVNVNLGLGLDINDDLLSKRISEFINNREVHLVQYDNAQKILDGKGVIRFADEIASLLSRR